jgi:Fe2+ or Zn2+ uptake regulation protein
MILDGALRSEGLFSADMLVDDLKALGHRVSRATVYRTLTHLHDAGILKQVFFDNKQSYFEVIAGGNPNTSDGTRLLHTSCLRRQQPGTRQTTSTSQRPKSPTGLA